MGSLRVSLLLCSVLTGSSAYASVQPDWIVSYNGGLSHGTNQVVAMALDPRGNIVIGASSTGAAGDYDYLALKYGPDGKQLWVARYASVSNGDDQLRAMAVDTDGNVLLTGTSVTVKYSSSNGTLQWTAPYAGRGIAVDTNGNAYVTGFSATDFATVKLNPNGSNEWVRTKDLFGLGFADHSERVALDPLGNVYVGGGGAWVCFFPPMRPPFCYWKFGVVKYDINGSELWTTSFPQGSPQGFDSVVALVSFGERVYFCGDGGAGGSSFYTTDLNAITGDPEWAQDFSIRDDGGAGAMKVHSTNVVYVTGGRSINRQSNTAYVTYKVSGIGSVVWEINYDENGVAGYHRANALALDSAENVFVTGQSGASDDALDWATIKYNPDGKEQWVQRYDGPAHGTDEAQAISVDSTGNVYVAGYQTTTNGSLELVLIKYGDLTNIQLQPDGAVLLQFFCPSGQVRHFQASADLADWSEVGTAVAGNDGIVRFTDATAPGNPNRFYRLAPP